MTISHDNLIDRSKERLASLPKYPSGQYLYYNWEHDSFKTEGTTKHDSSKAFIRNAENRNNV